MDDEKQMQTETEMSNIRQFILNGEPEVRDQYIITFKKDIDQFIGLAYRSYKAIESLEKSLPHEERAAWVDRYLFQSLNNLIVSFHLFISGVTVPSDHMMRHFCESIAIALLFSHSSINEYEKFNENKLNYPFHKSLNRVRKKENLRLLNLPASEWEAFVEIEKFFDPSSHSTVFAIALDSSFSESRLVLGAYFDDDKKAFYNKGIKLREHALNNHYNIVEYIRNNYK